MTRTDGPSVREITVKGPGSTSLTFTGTLLASADSNGPGRLRWAELKLYAWPEGSAPLVLHRVGRSLVYHASPSPCVPMRTARGPEELEDGAVPCPACRPARRPALSYDDLVIPEKSWHAYHLCKSLADAETVLWDTMPAGETIAGLPAVCRKLLAQAAQAAA